MKIHIEIDESEALILKSLLSDAIENFMGFNVRLTLSYQRKYRNEV